MNCPACDAEVLDIDVRCAACGAALGASGAHRMIGSTVLGQYEVIDVLGQGGMSIVYKARHKLTEQDVALKILPPELAAHSQVKSRFLEEARALASLDHANIVHLYNFGQENGCFVLAMQLVSGQTWERLILESKRLDWQTTTRIAIDVLRALEYAHGRGVVHRDMKPSNVLVRAHDGAATVMDFGIAKMTTSTKLTATGQTMGTVRYMSPEQVRGQEVDARTDIYSLGATMVESLTGETPFDGNTHFEIMTKHLSEPPPRPSARGVEVPAAVEDALMRSLAKRAEDRWESARDMRKALEAALRDADLGLVETQRVGRDKLAAALPRAQATATPAVMPPRNVSSGTQLADKLEPPAALQRRRSGAGVWVLAATVFLVIAGSGSAAYWWLRVRHRPAAVGPGGAAELRFEGSDRVTAAQLATAYRNALGRIDEGIAKLDKAHVTVTRPVDVMIAVPRAELCSPARYAEGIPVKSDCATAAHAIASAAPKTLLVSDDPAGLQAAVDTAVADAVCTLRTFDVANDPNGDQHARLADEICAQMALFLGNGSAVH